jgi:hypothetical protein
MDIKRNGSQPFGKGRCLLKDSCKFSLGIKQQSIRKHLRGIYAKDSIE